MLLKHETTHHLWFPPFALVKLGVRGLWLAWQPTSLHSLPLKSPETLHLKSEIQLMSASQPYLFALSLSTYLLLLKVCKGPQLPKPTITPCPSPSFPQEGSSRKATDSRSNTWPLATPGFPRACLTPCFHTLGSLLSLVISSSQSP